MLGHQINSRALANNVKNGHKYFLFKVDQVSYTTALRSSTIDLHENISNIFRCNGTSAIVTDKNMISLVRKDQHAMRANKMMIKKLMNTLLR